MKTDLFSGPKVPSTYCIYMCVYPNSCTNICFVIVCIIIFNLPLNRLDWSKAM